MMLSNSSNEGMQMGENISSSSFGEVDLSSLNEEQQQLLAKELIRNTPEYKAAWELELWKKREKQVFKKQLEQKQQMHLQKVEAALREEYSKKDKQLTDQREMLKQKEMKYTQALEDMEKREKQLIQVEQELRRRKTELESDYARKLEHMEHVIKMEKESFQHRLQLETIKNQELQKRIDQQLSHDVMELNEKITKLQVENESLESKLRETTNSKQSYKLQWKKVTEELQRAKKKHEAELRKLHQQVMALHQLQQQVTPSVNPTSPFQYPYGTPYGPPPTFPSMHSSAYTTNPVYYDSNLLNHHPLGSTPPRISSEKHEDEVNTLKTLISDLIKKEERDQKKQDKQLNTSSSSSSSGEDSRNSSPSPPRKKREVSSSKKTRSTPQDSSPLLDGSYEQADKDNNNETQDISLDAQTFSNSSPSNPFKEDSRSKEVNRLLREKARLLKSGIYNENSDIILEIDKKIQSL